MRILIHDYAGHAFPVQLSRALALRGHEVLHAFCGSTHTPRGPLLKTTDDPASFRVQPIDLGETIPKSGFLRRFQLESKYGDLIVKTCRDFNPEVVLSGNTPSIPQHRLSQHCLRHNIQNVFWVQDVYGVAAYKLLKRRLPVIGHAVGKYFISLDRKTAMTSDDVILITEDFRAMFANWGVKPDRIHVIENWAVIEELPVRPRNNPWSQEKHLGVGPRLIYSGTLGMKHNPQLLLDLATLLQRRGSGELIVVSEGPGVEWLQEQVNATGIDTMRFFPFQPFNRMADVLGSADLLVVILESDAGVFSVPSKALSYLCAGRPLLGAIPSENLISRIIAEHGVGTVVSPADSLSLCNAAELLLDSPDQMLRCGSAARNYAESHFSIATIVAQFEQIFSRKAA